MSTVNYSALRKMTLLELSSEPTAYVLKFLTAYRWYAAKKYGGCHD